MKSMLIFGGSGSIGQAIATAASKVGYLVVLADIKEPCDGDDFEYIATDATCEAQVKKAVLFTLERTGKLDVVVNCQGEYKVDRIEKTSVDELDKLLEVNLKSVFLVCKSAVPILKWQKNGYIINVASMAGLRGKRGETAYCASKFAVVGLTDALFAELQGSGVRVTAICPSSVQTPFVEKSVKLSETDKAKILQPEDIAGVVIELVSSSPRMMRKVVPIEIEGDIDKLEKMK